jgi:hypothetical protein
MLAEGAVGGLLLAVLLLKILADLLAELAKTLLLLI